MKSVNSEIGQKYYATLLQSHESSFKSFYYFAFVVFTGNVKSRMLLCQQMAGDDNRPKNGFLEDRGHDFTR